jgi:outer membrane protein assembly factor BamB
MTSHALALAALLATLSMCGCASNVGPSLSDSSGVQGVAKIDHEAWSTLGYRLDWQGFPFAGTVARAKVTFLTPAAPHVLVLESTGNVSVLDSNNGARRWTDAFGSHLTKFVGIHADPVSPGSIFVSAESELFIVDAITGVTTKRERFEKVVNTAPVLIDGLAIYGTSNGEVLAHRPNATLKAWGYATHSAIDANPVTLLDSIGIVSSQGNVYFFTSGGTLQGKNNVLGTMVTNPVSNGHYLAIAGLDQSLWCFDSRGNLTWRLRRSAPLAIQPAALDNAVVCELPEIGLTAVEFATGNILWSNKSVRGTVIATNKNRLFVWDGSTASIVDSARGELLATVEMPGVTSIVPDQFDGGNLYVATAEGSIAKFRLRN